MGNDRNVSMRRTLEQAKHCVEEALSVVERGEDSRCALDDLAQAGELIGVVRKALQRGGT